ncbi:MAG: hypothetical protein JSR48_09850 [Verrucomicrobia bacterium]|nr:hypothetical protein [Verrucomicrobiota bacterium]
MNPATDPAMEALRHEAGLLTAEWARLLAPHFGPSGSMDLDLIDWPKAQGPSYYNQFSHFTFLLLATGEIPGATAGEREKYLQLALRNLEYVLSITAPDFYTPHYSRGREWGRHVGEWLNYFVLCSLEVMERHHLGTPDLRRRLAAAVTGAVEVLYQRFLAKYAQPPAEFVGNHDTWHGLLFYRAGRTLQRPEWMAYAREFFARCVLPFQSADGYWPEGRGIVVSYALVTASAVSLYAELSGDEAAHASIGRFLGFYDFYSLPDGSTSVVNDVRVRYSRGPSLFLAPGFLGCAAGRQLCLSRMRAARPYFQETGVHDNGAQGFAFYGAFAEYVFRGDQHPRDLLVVAPTTLPAARLEQGSWQGYLGWQVVPENVSRFVLDTQDFVELWHRRAGYLAGTGGSKYMPRFSTVRRTDAGRSYIPDRAEKISADDRTAAVGLHFGDDEVRIGLAVDQARAEFSARIVAAPSSAHYEAALILPFRRGEPVRLDEELVTIDPAALIHFNGGSRPVARVGWRDLTWILPAGAVIDYPVVPHNSYTQDGLPLPDDYVARISFPLASEVRTVSIA